MMNILGQINIDVENYNFMGNSSIHDIDGYKWI